MNKIVTQILLEASLADLHSQTKEWIEDVEFYTIELNFLRGFVLEKIDNANKAKLSHKVVYGNVDILLSKLSKDLIKDLKTHEKLLDGVIKDKNSTENREYRTYHITLHKKMKVLKKGLKELKSNLFNYLKGHLTDFSIDPLIEELSKSG